MTVFKPSYGMKRTVSKITTNCKSQEEKAIAISQWMNKNIEYKSKRFLVYRKNARQIYNDRRGICGEQSVLYVTMARLAGINANWVSMDQDEYGRKIRHACVSINLDNQRIYVDPTNNEYDIHPKKTKQWDDYEVSNLFSEIRAVNRRRTVAKILIPVLLIGGIYMFNEKTNKISELKKRVSITLEHYLE